MRAAVIIGLVLLAVCAVHAEEEEAATDPPVIEDEVEADATDVETEAEACVLELTAEGVSDWYLGMSAHADKEKYAALLVEADMSGKTLDATVADEGHDLVLTDLGMDDEVARSELVKGWADKKEATCEEELDPKYLLPSLTLSSTLACSACSEVVEAVWDEVTAVKPDVEDRSLKERREAAHKIVDEVCGKILSVEVTGEKFEERFLVHKAFKKSKKKKKKKKSKKTEEKKDDAEEKVETAEDGEDTAEKPADEEDKAAEDKVEDQKDAEEAAEEDEEEDEEDAVDEDEKKDKAEEDAEEARKLLAKGNPEDTAQLQEACGLLMANHGLKLKSKLAGFYKETTKDGIRKKMCFQWEDLCYASPKPKLKKREKCLMKAFKAIQNQEWEMAAKYTACAKKALKVKRKKSKKSEQPEVEVEVEAKDTTAEDKETAEEDEDDSPM